MGCEEGKNGAGSWNPGKTKAGAPSADAIAQSSAESGSSSGVSASGAASDGALNGDEVAFGLLNWSYGGVDGSHATQAGVTIANLSVSGDGLAFQYVSDLSAWGLSNGSAGAIACFFVQRMDGSWVGGKFDWISSSRTTRSFTNIRGGYVGWSTSGCANPCPCAFVIIDGSGMRRSNVLSGTWTR